MNIRVYIQYIYYNGSKVNHFHEISYRILTELEQKNESLKIILKCKDEGLSY